MIDTALQQNIQSLVEENNALSLEAENIEAFLEKENIKPEEIDDYRSNSILKLLWKDFWSLIGVMIFLGIISAILSAIGLVFIVVIAGFLFAFAFLATYFKQIIIYGITILILSQINNTEWLILIATILFVPVCRYQDLSKRQEQIEYLDEIEQRMRANYKQIIHLATPSVVSLLQQEQMVDVHSVREHGLSFLPHDYIQDILDEQIELGVAERIVLPQKNTILYKSKINVNNEEMTTTYLEID